MPLIVPEVNPHCVQNHQGIIANPNCSTIQMLVVLKPLHDYAKVKRVVVSTYQAVSGTGLNAIEELQEQSRQLLQDKEVQPLVYPHQIAFNVLPHIDIFNENGYSLEELKMVQKQKVLDPRIEVTATCVRVPVIVATPSQSISRRSGAIPRTSTGDLASAPGISVLDEPTESNYPLPIFLPDAMKSLWAVLEKITACPTELTSG